MYTMYATNTQYQYVNDAKQDWSDDVRKMASSHWKTGEVLRSPLFHVQSWSVHKTRKERADLNINKWTQRIGFPQQSTKDCHV